jgi:HSP20 family protein
MQILASDTTYGVGTAFAEQVLSFFLPFRSTMALFRFGHNWDPFGDLEREVDRLLRSVDLTFHGIRLGRQYPAVNLYEFEEEYVLTAELPGTKLDDLELTFAGGLLTLKGRRDDAAEVPENRYRRSERFHGEWQRVLSLPERIQDEGLTATFTDGVLRVRLPKGSPAPVRQIAVTEGSDQPHEEGPLDVG